MKNSLKALACLLLLLTLNQAAFQEVFLNVVIDAREDGTAHVQETFRLFMTDKSSSEIYDSISSESENDITSWKTRTGINDVRHHFDLSFVSIDIEKIRIRPQPKDTCSVFQGTCYATLTMDYDVSPIYSNGTRVNGTGLFFTEKSKPRTTSYTLNTKALSFESSKTGDIVIPENTVLTIHLPTDSVVKILDPLPPDLKGKHTPLRASQVEEFSWKGQTTLAGFVFNFEREEQLSTEVIQFFKEIEFEAKKVLFSIEGLALLLIAAIAVASFALLKKKE